MDTSHWFLGKQSNSLGKYGTIFIKWEYHSALSLSRGPVTYWHVTVLCAIRKRRGQPEYDPRVMFSSGGPISLDRSNLSFFVGSDILSTRQKDTAVQSIGHKYKAFIFTGLSFAYEPG
jgi:hypothetical protein